MDTDPGFPWSYDCDHSFRTLLYSEPFLSPQEATVRFARSTLHVVGDNPGSGKREDSQVSHCLPVDYQGSPSHSWCFLHLSTWSTGICPHPPVQFLQVQLGICKGQTPSFHPIPHATQLQGLTMAYRHLIFLSLVLE